MGVGRFIRKAPVHLALTFNHPEAFDDVKAGAGLVDLAESLGRKDVAVVGNAQSIHNHPFGSEIDAHDIVARMNHGIIRSPATQGTRTDALFIASHMSTAAVERHFGTPPVIFTSTHRARMKLSFALDYPRLYFSPRALYHGLERELDGRRPSTGLVTFRLFDTVFAATRVTLYGFDWMTTKTTYHDDLRSDWHDWPREREIIMARIAAEPSRFRLRLVETDLQAETPPISTPKARG